jgi:hypothetical protein
MPLSLGETKSCCFIAYDGVTGERYSLFDNSIWSVSRHWADRISGFKAALIEPNGGTSVSVLAFAGTDSILDAAVDILQAIGGVPIQYSQAIILASGAQSTLGGRLNLAGHSLGGGLAAYCSSALRIPTSTVNPAPLVGAATFSALFARNAQITNYIAQGGEVVSSSPGRNPGQDVYVPSTGGTFGFFTDHMLSNVAPSIPLPVKL